MSFGDLEVYERMYQTQEPFGEHGFVGTEHILVWLIPVICIYLYIRFFEDRLIFFVDSKLIPFVRFRMRLDGIINFVDNILKIKIFAYDKNR